MAYSTASTADAVYIIGGWVDGRMGDGSSTPSKTIARYTMGENWRDGCCEMNTIWGHYGGLWTQVGDLKTNVRINLLYFNFNHIKPYLSAKLTVW